MAANYYIGCSYHIQILLSEASLTCRPGFDVRWAYSNTKTPSGEVFACVDSCVLKQTERNIEINSNDSNIIIFHSKKYTISNYGSGSGGGGGAAENPQGPVC